MTLLDLIYLALTLVLFVLTIWMIRLFGRV